MERLSFVKKESVRFGVLVALILGAWFSVEYFDLREEIKNIFSGDIRNFGLSLPLLFVASYVILIVALLPTSPLNIISGVVFGPVLGTLYSWLGVIIGGSISFILARFLGESFVSKLINEKSNFLQKYNEKISEGGFGTVLLFRIIPFFPIGGFNYLFGLTKMKFRSYFFASAIGVLPGVFILSYFGDSISNPNFLNITITASMVIIVALASFLYKKKTKI